MGATVSEALSLIDGETDEETRSRAALMVFEACRDSVVRVARRYSMAGASRDDVEQEALLELWRRSLWATSRTWQVPIGEGMMVNYVKMSLGYVCRRERSAKNRPLLDARRVLVDADGLEERTVEVAVPDPFGLGRDPLDRLVDREEFVERLSNPEEKVSRSRADRLKLVEDLRRQGLTGSAIARELRVAHPTVAKDLQHLGLNGHLPSANVREVELRCTGCGEWKPDDAFPHSRSNPARRGRHSLCRPCGTAARRSWRERNPEKQRTYDRSRKRIARDSRSAPAREGSACCTAQLIYERGARYCSSCWALELRKVLTDAQVDGDG